MKKLNVIILRVAMIGLIACGGDKKVSTSDNTINSKATTSSSTDKSSSDAGNRKGKLVYKQYCVICHGADGTLAVSGATDLSTSTVTLEERIDQITNGKGLMTPYKDILSQEQIKAVAEFIEELRK